MNIEYLKYFAELAKLQHYGKAAKALNISQPGLSHAIKTLEDEYGVPLFQKEGRNVSLSRYGKELMQDVEEILDAYLRMEERAAGLRTEEKTVRIGTVYPLAAGTIPHMLREFGATFPFIIYNRLTPEIEEGLLDGKYDIGFCSELLKSEELEYYPLRESYIAAAVPEGHPLEGKENITLKEAAKYPQVMFSRTSGFRSLQEQIFAEQGIQVKPVCEAEEIEVITGPCGKWFWNIYPPLHGHRPPPSHHRNPGADLKLEIKILHRQKKIRNPHSAGRGVFSALEEMTGRKFYGIVKQNLSEKGEIQNDQ